MFNCFRICPYDAGIFSRLQNFKKMLQFTCFELGVKTARITQRTTVVR